MCKHSHTVSKTFFISDTEPPCNNKLSYGKTVSCAPCCSSHLSLVISDLPVELFSLQAQEVLPGQQDSTLGCNGTGSVDVVSSNHTYSDTCTLALGDRLRYLQSVSESCYTRVQLSGGGVSLLYVHVDVLKYKKKESLRI